MLTGCQNVPCTIFMQISSAIIDKSVFPHILANKTHNGTNKMSTPRFSLSKITIRLFLGCNYVYFVLYLIGGKILCKLGPPLSRNRFFSISQLIIHIIEQIRSRFSWSKIIIRLFLGCIYVYLLLYLIGGKILCKLIPTLSRNQFFTISLPIIHTWNT